MNENKVETSLADFIKKTKDSAVEGLGDDWKLAEPIKLELSAIVKGKVGGGLEIQIVNFGAKIEAEQIQKISLAISQKDEVSEAQKAAKVAAAEVELRVAKNKIKNLTGEDINFG